MQNLIPKLSQTSFISKKPGFLSEKLKTLMSSNYRAGKIRFSGAQKSVLLRVSSGKRCAPQSFVHLVTFRGTHGHLIV